MADKGLADAEAGVDINAGNRMVDLIKPPVRATARPGADAEIGGFGGLFDLKRAGNFRSGAGSSGAAVFPRLFCLWTARARPDAVRVTYRGRLALTW
jgi:hypothetical protein